MQLIIRDLIYRSPPNKIDRLRPDLKGFAPLQPHSIGNKTTINNRMKKSLPVYPNIKLGRWRRCVEF